MEDVLKDTIKDNKNYGFKTYFLELARKYSFDRRTVKKYYMGYEKKPKTRNKPSRLYKYKDKIIERLQI